MMMDQVQVQLFTHIDARMKSRACLDEFRLDKIEVRIERYPWMTWTIYSCFLSDDIAVAVVFI